MINFSCADFTFPLLSHDKALQVIALLDFKYVDIGLFTDRSHIQPGDQFDFPERRGKELLEKASRLGLGISDVFLQSALDYKEKAINNPAASVRTMERDTFRKLIDFTLATGCDHVTGLPGVGFETDGSISLCIEELFWRVEYAGSMAVIYSVEPHLGSIMSTPESAIEILQKVNGLTVTLDHSHYTSQGFDVAAVDPLIKYSSHMHARGAAPGEMQTSAARNKTDFRAVVKSLKEVQYERKICMEYCWLEWENCNRTDNISETILLRNQLKELLSSADI